MGRRAPVRVVIFAAILLAIIALDVLIAVGIITWHEYLDRKDAR